jgi:UDP-N-acetylmuramate--alanine ligase
VHVGHDASHVGEAEIVTFSTAVPASNPELAEAARRGLSVVTRAETLAAVCACRRCVAVAGTHGKTTTTAMLSLILVEAGMRPSFLIGGDVNEIGTNAVWDGGDWLVVEADESDGTFLQLAPELSVLTNVEADHLDHYGNMEALVSAFDRFCAGRSLGVVAGADDAGAARIGRRHGAVLVGASDGADFRVEDVRGGPEGVSFRLVGADGTLGALALPVAGAKTAQNAALATVAAMVLGVPFDAAGRALARFGGVARRYQARGERDGVRFVDDYAHLPTEVAAVIDAARAEQRRLVVVFQPHRYTRVAALAEQFADAFVGADVVLVTDVFPAGEAPIPGVSGMLVVDALHRAHPEADVRYVAGRPELREELGRVLRPGDLCLTLGAGDLTSLPDDMLEALSW